MQGHRAFAYRHRSGGEPGAHTLSHRLGTVDVGDGQQAHESIGPVAGQHVFSAQQLAANPGELYQGGIAGGGAVLVVELRELVEVEHNQR